MSVCEPGVCRTPVSCAISCAHGTEVHHQLCRLQDLLGEQRTHHNRGLRRGVLTPRSARAETQADATAAFSLAAASDAWLGRRLASLCLILTECLLLLLVGILAGR